MRNFVIMLLAGALFGCPEPAEPSAALPDTPADTAVDSDAPGGQDAQGDTVTGPLDLVNPPAEGQARAGVITDPDALIAGPKSDGRIGDVKMFNSRVAVIIEGARLASGFRAWGGNIVDTSARRADGTWTLDTFGEIGHTWNLKIFEPQAVEIVNDGRDGEEAHVRVSGVVAPMAWAEDLLGALTLASEISGEVVYDYFLAPDAQVIRHEVRLTNITSEVAEVDVPIILSSQGDGIFHWRKGQGFSDDAGATGFIGMTGRDLAHGLFSADSPLTFLIEQTGAFVVTEEAFSLAPGETQTRTYFRAISPDGINGVEQLGAELGSLAQLDGIIEGTVTLPSSASSRDAWVTAWVDGEPHTMGPVRADGSYRLAVAAGDYEVRHHVLHHAAPAAATVSVAAGGTETVDVSVEASGTVRATVTDNAGDAVPARIMALASSEMAAEKNPQPPSVVDIRGQRQWSWGSGFGRVSGVGYAADGTVDVRVPAGTYTVQATRGLFYGTASAEVTVTAGQTTEVALTIASAVDRTGWITGDFHIHAARSPDSHVPHEIRALQAITEGIDAPVITEHIALRPLEPEIETLGLKGQVLNVGGQEVSTVVFGHFNAFPLQWRPDEANGGNVIEFGRTPSELFAGVQEQSGRYSPFLQVNHPRSSSPIQAYFTYVALDPVTAQPTKNVDRWDTSFDGIEVFNESCNKDETFQDWVNLTNLGMRKALSSGSDTHGENDPIGRPRQVVAVDFATVDNDAQAIADAMKARRAIVSCGPMVTFETDDGLYGLGEMAPTAADGSVSFRVTVQAPAWQTLVEARLLRNGELVDSVSITETAAGLRLDTVLSDTPAADAWYMVEVTGSGSLLPVQTGGPPAAFTNPIEVDADGDGTWTPPGLP